jgi:hypothetical protein
MAPTLYPRGTVKKIVKAHSNRQLSKNVDILVRQVRLSLRNPVTYKSVDLPELRAFHARVCISILPHPRTEELDRHSLVRMGNNDKGLTVHRLINEASIKSKQSGERGISARSVRKVSETTLRKYKG